MARVHGRLAVVALCWLGAGCAEATRPGVVRPEAAAIAESGTSAESAPQSEAWREIFDAAGWPHIGRATRVTSRRTDPSGRILCIEGWHVRTERGPIVVFDDLHVEWGAMFWEHWPQSQRVPLERYDDLPDLRAVRSARAMGLGRRVRPRFAIGSTAAFLDQIVKPDCAHPASGPITPSSRLFHMARSRWAEMLGHPGLAMLQREREPWAFEDDDALHDEVARVLTEQTRWALSRGMSRREARTRFERARSIVRSPDRKREIEATLRDLGDDPAPWSTEPTIEELVAALADDQYFPDRRWGQGAPRPTWARSGALQPASPAWELVARGWEALPALRDAARSTRSTRRFHARMTPEGVTTLVGTSADRLALTAASLIAGRTFTDADELDRWWVSVGVRGREEAWLAVIAAPDVHAPLRRIVEALVRSGAPDVWSAVGRALADRSHPRRAELLSALGDALEREPDEASTPLQDATRARRLATRYLHDPARGVRLAAVSVFLAMADRGAYRQVAAHLVREASRGELDLDETDAWWRLVEDLHDRDPGSARRTVRAATRAPQHELRDAAREWLGEVP